jgi:seryl-tRNA synthetase
MQAYTVELEEEVSQLKEENKRLREQQEALRKAVSTMLNTLQSLSSLSVFSRCCESANLTFQLILLSAEVHGLATISLDLPKYCCGLFGILCRDDILQFSPIQRCHEFTQTD